MMQIPLGVITYRRPKYLRKTLDSFFRLNYDVLEVFKPVVVLVQGADTHTMGVLNHFHNYIDRVIELKGNHGCAWAYTLINQELLEEGTDLVMHLQDDWLSTEPLTHYLFEDRYEHNKGIKQLFDERQDVGYLRMRSARRSSISSKNRITKEKIRWKKFGSKYERYNRVLIGNAHYTFNPSIIRTSVLRKILPVVKERDAMEKYHKLDLLTGLLNGNCFIHIGRDRATTKIGKKERWLS
jgi:hypothetical protein